MEDHRPVVNKIGSGKPYVAVVFCQHGDEPLGKEVAEKLWSLNLKRGTLFTVFANPLAFEKEARFVDSDLNRSFPGNPNGNYGK